MRVAPLRSRHEAGVSSSATVQRLRYRHRGVLHADIRCGVGGDRGGTPRASAQQRKVFFARQQIPKVAIARVGRQMCEKASSYVAEGGNARQDAS